MTRERRLEVLNDLATSIINAESGCLRLDKRDSLGRVVFRELGLLRSIVTSAIKVEREAPPSRKGERR